METRTFTAPAIRCGHCTHTIETELKDLPGVRAVQAEAESKQVTVSWEVPATWEDISALLDDIGFPAES